MISKEDFNLDTMEKRIEFIDTLDQYSYNEDLVCKIKFGYFTPHKLERIGLFKLGWQSIKDCIVSKYLPTEGLNKEIGVTFEKNILPKKENTLFQFCYLSRENELYEASLPFTFGIEKSERVNESSIRSRDILNHSSLGSLVSSYTEPAEIVKLREENELLRACLKALVLDKQQNAKKADNDSKISEIKELVNSMKTTFIQHHQEVAVLKHKFLEMQKENKKICEERLELAKKVENLENKHKAIESVVVLNKVTTDESDITTDSVTSQSKCSSSTEFNIENMKSIPPFPF